MWRKCVYRILLLTLFFNPYLAKAGEWDKNWEEISTSGLAPSFYCILPEEIVRYITIFMEPLTLTAFRQTSTTSTRIVDEIIPLKLREDLINMTCLELPSFKTSLKTYLFIQAVRECLRLKNFGVIPNLVVKSIVKEVVPPRICYQTILRCDDIDKIIEATNDREFRNKRIKGLYFGEGFFKNGYEIDHERAHAENEKLIAEKDCEALKRRRDACIPGNSSILIHPFYHNDLPVGARRVSSGGLGYEVGIDFVREYNEELLGYQDYATVKERISRVSQLWSPSTAHFNGEGSLEENFQSLLQYLNHHKAKTWALEELLCLCAEEVHENVHQYIDQLIQLESLTGYTFKVLGYEQGCFSYPRDEDLAHNFIEERITQGGKWGPYFKFVGLLHGRYGYEQDIPLLQKFLDDLIYAGNQWALIQKIRGQKEGLYGYSKTKNEDSTTQLSRAQEYFKDLIDQGHQGAITLKLMNLATGGLSICGVPLLLNMDGQTDASPIQPEEALGWRVILDFLRTNQLIKVDSLIEEQKLDVMPPSLLIHPSLFLS